MSKRTRALQTLRDRRGYGEGWVTGLELLQAGCGVRYAARVHELREQGHIIECDTSKRDNFGDVISRFRLTFDVERDNPQGDLFGAAA